MSDQRNNFKQDEVYEKLEFHAVTVQIGVCCDLTPRGLLDTYRRTGTPAASIVIYAEEKVPDFSETLISIYKTISRHIPRCSVESFKKFNFNPVRIEIFCLSFRIPMLVAREIRVHICSCPSHNEVIHSLLYFYHMSVVIVSPIRPRPLRSTSVTTMVMRTRHNVTLYAHCPSCYNYCTAC